MTNEKGTDILMYSTSWCPDCLRAKLVFHRFKVDYTEVDVDHSEEGLKVVVEHNNGVRVVPTIFFPDGSVLVEPSNEELRDKIESLKLAPTD